ncbi:CrcB-like protein [Trypanosoma rangeli]|uniref:CrcB-like protein n=1 Tax=Trypanosoma rangeli TaxID=5698 RepID=A0A422NPK8_TRYRA|nr:CrcB-like protein [Trypanosoma rangeli]RNF07319.1 CrcB-like protein [Trypanosoma rangeli]|eukprot:RNF07319.1 CrcB-like protein [Trypanosoma rangeli]
MYFVPRPLPPFEVEENASELHAEEEAETRELEAEPIAFPAPSVQQGGTVPDVPSMPPKSILDDGRVTHVAAVIGVACWSLAGTALRLKIGRCLPRHGFLTTYTTFGANCIGCFLMGFIEATASIQTQSKTFPWIFRSLLTGFCGSLTTFSSWMLDTVGRDTAALDFGELLSGLTIPFVFLLWGHDTVSMLRAVTGLTRRRRVSLSTSNSLVEHSRRQLHLANIVFLVLSVVMAVGIPIAVEVAVRRGLLDVSLIDRRSVIIAPLGAVPRYALGHLLNGTGRFWRLPVGTFTANFIAVLLMGITDYHFRHEGNVWCKIVMNGLCGSLSTVSSFINEIVAMYSLGHRRSAYIYAAASVAVSAVIMSVCRHALS